MKPKTKKIIDIVATVIPVLMVVMSAIFKFAGGAEVVTKLTSIGVGGYIPVLGAMELVFAVLFIFPQTMRIGFILLSCYFAGAIATDLSHNNSVANAMMPIMLVWISAFIRDKSVFLQVVPKRKMSLE